MNSINLEEIYLIILSIEKLSRENYKLGNHSDCIDLDCLNSKLKRILQKYKNLLLEDIELKIQFGY